MKSVRQRMIKPLTIILLPILGLLSSCNPTELTGTGVKSNVIVNDGSFDGKAFVYEDSPYYMAGQNYGPHNVNMGSFLGPSPKLITTNTNLTGNCAFMAFMFTVALDQPCIQSLANSSRVQATPRKADRTFIFSPNSPEFYETNALYHITKGTDTFLKKLAFAYEKIHSTLPHVPKSLPSYLVNSKLFWFKSVTNSDSHIFRSDFLTSYAQCELDKNASFSPAGPTLCFGGFSEYPGFYFVQDPDIIYHELAHALVSVMMNTRNGTSASDYHPFRSNLGSYGYDEAGSINEGVADYYAYVMTNNDAKTERRIGEFSLGRTVAQARPVSEAHSVHIPGIEENSSGRLSYPHYLLYDPNEPDSISEDVHYAGQIVTHYLVALTKNLKQQCSLPSNLTERHDRVTSYVMLLLAETLSELGDLNAKGVDLGSFPYSNPNIFFNNLDKTNSFTWAHVINQVTYRRFFQVFGKNINKYISNNLCPQFDKNDSENLLDDYGLLLFKTYNDNGNSTKSRLIEYGSVNTNLAGQPLTPVSEDNRRKSVLVSKQLLGLAARTDENPLRVSYYIIDNQKDIKALLQELLFKGFPVPLSSGSAGTEYNNSNIKISPGEVVAVIPNLMNNSNSTMAGIQLLATDWDHIDLPASQASTGYYKPCVVDNVTTVDQGGEAGNTCTSTYTEYNRMVRNPLTSLYPSEGVAPVCLIQFDDGTVSRWVSQNEFRKKKEGLALQDKDCLGYSTTGNADPDFTFNTNECLVRFLPAANDAFFSKIDAQKTYYETVVAQSQEGSFNAGNLLLMEVNKAIPPGTKIRCRLRARFSNCSDCYADPQNANDDYLDYELNGHKPFKVINFDFDVND